MKAFKIILTIILITIYLIFALWIIGKNFIFSGFLEINYDFETESPFISLLKPRGRVDQDIKTDESGDYYQRLLIDPVYFDVNLPRSFKKAQVKIKYKNPYEQILEMGISESEESDNIYLQPIENKHLDILLKSDEYNKTRQEKTVLLQKEKKYNSIKEFLDNLPDYNQIATYNYDLQFTYIDNDYKKSNEILELNKSLRGSHKFYTYIKDENFDFTFNFQDVNRVEGKDEIEIAVYFNNDKVYSKKLNDDGIEDNSSNMGAPYDYRVLLENPKEGVYQVEINSSDDIFIRQIRTTQKYVSFIDHIYLADNVGYLNEKDLTRYDATNIYTNSEKINIITSHKEGYQEVSFSDQKLEIDEKHIIFSLSKPLSERENLLETIELPKNDIKVIGKGLFALSKETFFNPKVFELNGDPNLNLENIGIKYIIANYKNPESVDSWKIQTITFDLQKFNDGDNNYRFAFSFPYFKEPETDIRISDIKMELYTDPVGIKDFIIKSINQIRRIFFKYEN